MRIGIVCYPTYGGSGVVATELGAALAARGHRVHIISSSMPFRLSSLTLNENIYFHEVPHVDYPLFSSELQTLSLATKIRQVATDERLELIHAHYAIPHAASAWIAREMLAQEKRPLPFITTLHGTDITLVGRSPSFQSIVTFVLRESDAATAVSRWLAAETRRHFSPCRDIEVIYNFIDPERFRPGANRCPRGRFAEPDEKIVLHISNFRPVKRVGDVVAVFAGIAERVKSKLLLVGDGPDREPAMQAAREFGVDDRTWFLGKQNNIEGFLGIADLFLFPSEHESFGLAALEAMSCEVPVIASRSGGLVEVIDHERTGFLHSPGDTEAMIASGLQLFQQEGLAREIGRAARQSVIERFHPESIVPQYEALYERVLNGGSDIGPVCRGTGQEADRALSPLDPSAAPQ